MKDSYNVNSPDYYLGYQEGYRKGMEDLMERIKGEVEILMLHPRPIVINYPFLPLSSEAEIVKKWYEYNIYLTIKVIFKYLIGI